MRKYLSRNDCFLIVGILVVSIGLSVLLFVISKKGDVVCVYVDNTLFGDEPELCVLVDNGEIDRNPLRKETFLKGKTKMCIDHLPQDLVALLQKIADYLKNSLIMRRSSEYRTSQQPPALDDFLTTFEHLFDALASASDS